MWKPEDWKNPYAPADYPSGVVSAFEAGADAMHKAVVGWVEEHRYKTKYLEGDVVLSAEDWQAFRETE